MAVSPRKRANAAGDRLILGRKVQVQRPPDGLSELGDRPVDQQVGLTGDVLGLAQGDVGHDEVVTAKDAFDWAGLYRRRWAIEQLFEGPEGRRTAIGQDEARFLAAGRRRFAEPQAVDILIIQTTEYLIEGLVHRARRKIERLALTPR